MKKYNLYLYDDIGNQYERKNEYIKEIALLQEKIENASKDEKIKLKSDLKLLVKNKNKHPYNIKESEFLKQLKQKLSKINYKFDDRKIKNLQLKLFENREKYNFYRDYMDLSYEINLKLRESKLILEQLPDEISFLEENKGELRRLKEKNKVIKDSLENNSKADYKIYKSYKAEQKEILKREINRLKIKKKDGLISKKARRNLEIEFKKEYKNKIDLQKVASPLKANNEKFKNVKHSIKNIAKQNLMVLKANIADIRTTPVETEKTIPIFAYSTFLIPGLGQILNKQYNKGLLFILATLFTYLIAIPYALGFGNYQGDGVYGLISLAEGGLRIDKSLIFMIEGIIAIFLLIIASFLIVLSFKDVYTVEKNKIKGIREKNWFESKMVLKEEGFPYLVSSPAFLIIIFIVLVPIVTTLLISFTGMDPNHQSKFGWVGIQNYKLITLGEGLAGSVFWLILGWTVIWTLLATTLAIAIGFGLALLVNNERVKFKGFFRTIYLLPWAVPAFITIMFFSIMLSPNGALTEIINNIVGSRIEVKNNTNLTRIALIFLQGWLGSAYVFLLSTGVLQAIPKDLYEAAEIDGATSWQKTLKITIPLVLFQTAPLLVTQYTFNFNNFSIIHLFNGGGPFNPSLYGNLAGSSDLLISYIYKLTIENQYQAIGAAITIFISMGLMFFAYLGFRNSKGFKEGKL